MWKVFTGLVALCIALGAIALHQHRKVQSVEAKRRNEKEAALLDQQGFLRSKQAREKEMQEAIESMLKMNGQLSMQVQKLKKLHPRVKPVLTQKIVTEPTVAPSSPDLPDCLIAKGDTVWFESNFVAYRTDEENYVITGTVSVMKAYGDEVKELLKTNVRPGGSQVSYVKGFLAEPEAREPKPRYAVHGAAVWSKAQQSPTGIQGGLDIRTLRNYWLTSNLQMDSKRGGSAALGLRVEF